MIVVMPFYITIPFIAIALVVAAICPEPNFWKNYKYYTVATIYDRDHANQLFGERSIFPKGYLVQKLQRFKIK